MSITRSLAKAATYWPPWIATIGLGAALALLGLLCMSPGPLAQGPDPSIASTDPMPNAVGVPVGLSIVVTCSSAISTSTVTTATLVAHGMLGGLVNGTFTFPGGDTILALDPVRSFHEGELVRVSATAGIRASSGQPLRPYQWQFTAGTVRARCLDGFAAVDAGLVDADSGSVAWGDYDQDRDLDILVTGETSASTYVSSVYRNDGPAGAGVWTFTDINAGLVGVWEGSGVWGDYDNDGDLDVLLAGEVSYLSYASRVYRNNGDGTFADIGAALPGVIYGAVAWGDYDNDGHLDILLTGLAAGSEGPISRVYRNDGNGAFSDIHAGLAGAALSSAAWGDYDQDGDLDILLAGENITPLARLYRNDECGGLLLSKEVTPGSAAPGEPITYTLTYTNDGHQVVDGVRITDIVPSQLAITDYAYSGALITPTGGVSYTWQVGALTPGSGGGVITITGWLGSPLAAGVFTNTASIGGMVASTPLVRSAAVEVRVLNVPPFANADGYTVSEDRVLVVPAPGVLGNDGDANGDSLTVHPESDPASGTLALYADGGLVYTPTLDWNGMVTFTYHVHDTGSAVSQIARVTITVTARNDPPTVSSIPDQSTTEGEPVGPLTFTVGDVDSPLDALTLSGTSSSPALAPATSITFGGSGITRTVTVTPTAGITGTARITVTLSDGTDSASTSFLLAVDGRPPRLLYLPLVCKPAISSPLPSPWRREAVFPVVLWVALPPTKPRYGHLPGSEGILPPMTGAPVQWDPLCLDTVRVI